MQRRLKAMSALPAVAGLVGVVVLVGLMLWQGMRGKPGEQRMQADYVVNVEDARALAGLADFVFAGRVEQLTNTKYESVVRRTDGTIASAIPYSYYRITVHSSIKGGLKEGVSLTAFKRGGLAPDGSAVVLMEGDILPQVGADYVFYANACADGRLLILGKNATVPIVAEQPSAQGPSKSPGQPSAQADAAAIAESPAVREAASAVANEQPFAREHYTLPAAWLG